MRIPAKAPSIAEMTGHGTEPSGDVRRVSGYNRRYLHWDDLEYRTAADEREGLWLSMKTARLPGIRFDIGKERFCFNITEDISGTLALADRMRDGGPSSEHTGIYEESIASCQLEGATTDRLTALRMLERGLEPKDRSELMICNCRDAMAYALDRSDRPVTPGLVTEIQRRITAGLMDDPADEGRFRSDDSVSVRDVYEDVTYHRPVPCRDVPDCMDSLCAFLNRDDGIHPLVKSVLAHFLIAYIHPFADGNGRTARCLFHMVAAGDGYGFLNGIAVSRSIMNHRGGYGRAFLLTETDGNDVTYFLKYNMAVMEEAIGTSPCPAVGTRP